MSLIPKGCHSSWNKFLTDEIVMELDSIERKIGSNINPAPDKVLRFMQCNLDDIKVVILGQDPYPEKGKYYSLVARGINF
jgi:uracil-DNA glycosylase